MKPLQHWLFQKIHGNNLVYNTCWEDPRCDRELLQIDEESEIVMITSAGCNALVYLLDQPKRIYCVDMNPRQNALLELKKAFYRIDDYENLFRYFGDGKSKDVKQFYKNNLRNVLPDFAQRYWDKNIGFFNGNGFRKSFYYHGSSGMLAWVFKSYLKFRKELYQNIEQFFQSPNLEQQEFNYRQIENKIWSKNIGWLLNNHLVMSMAGVPKSQQNLFVSKYENGAVDFIKNCMNNVFTNLPVQENYFWHLYFNGKYAIDCCPEYLKEKNFNYLSQKIDAVETYTTTISEFLKENPKNYTHFVLLDHQDWLAENNVEALEEEWELILNNSKKGTKILLRSASEQIDFFPDFVLEKVEFNKELTTLVHQRDRVGTYASTYLGIVK